MKKNTYNIIYTLVFIIAIAIDHLTKSWATTELAGGNKIEIIPGVLELVYLENKGAAFGLLQNQFKLFYVITIIVVILIMVFLTVCPKEKKYLGLTIPASLILAGTLGNYIDRSKLGYVVDFIYISLIDFPVFNFADILITWDTVLVAILILFKYSEEDINRIKLTK